MLELENKFVFGTTSIYFGFWEQCACGNLYAENITKALKHFYWCKIISWNQMNTSIFNKEYSAGEMVKRKTGDKLKKKHFRLWLKKSFSLIWKLKNKYCSVSGTK